MKSPRQHSGHRLPIRVVHWLLLLGWLFSSQGIAPAICLAAAVFDGDHAVKVGTSDAGFTVVLSHEGKTAEEMARHEHDLLCALLVSMSGESTKSHDHVLAFKTVDDALRSVKRCTSGGELRVPCAMTLWMPDGAGGRCVSGLDDDRLRFQSVTRSPCPARPAGIRVMLC